MITDKIYINALSEILNDGVKKNDRTGTGTISKFGMQMRFNLRVEFPILTTKKVNWHSIVTELLWFLRGDTNIKYLHKHNVSIWDEWATDTGEIGSMYGKQWRDWNGVDQIQQLIVALNANPDSRRHVVSAWNVQHLPNSSSSPQDNVKGGKMALAPCHHNFQCYVSEGQLSMLVNQRSADFLLGVPFNIASYALLTHMLAQVCNLQVGELIWNGGDCHVYSNHLKQANEQIDRYTRGEVYQSPSLELDTNIRNIDDFTHGSIRLVSYNHAPPIKAPIAV